MKPTHSTISDEELIVRYKASQDNSITGELYKRYSMLVFGLCYKYLKEETEAQDAVTEIFVLVAVEVVVERGDLQQAGRGLPGGEGHRAPEGRGVGGVDDDAAGAAGDGRLQLHAEHTGPGDQDGRQLARPVGADPVVGPVLHEVTDGPEVAGGLEAALGHHEPRNFSNKLRIFFSKFFKFLLSLFNNIKSFIYSSPTVLLNVILLHICCKSQM